MSGQVPGKTKTQDRVYRVLAWLLPAAFLKWLGNCLSLAPINYITVELTAIERAKMDYEHHWKRGELFLDKGCFTVVAGLVAGIVVILGNYFLEDYRSREARERVLTEERLKALTAMAAAHSKMTRAFFTYSDEKPNTPADTATKEHQKAIDEFMHETNKHLPLLGAEFDKDVSWYTACHRKFCDLGVTKCGKYGELASNLDNEFNALCEAYLRKGRLANEDRMVLKPIYRYERASMKPEDYIAAQPAYRKEKGKDDKVP